MERVLFYSTANNLVSLGGHLLGFELRLPIDWIAFHCVPKTSKAGLQSDAFISPIPAAVIVSRLRPGDLWTSGR